MKASPLLPVEEQMMFWQEHSTGVTQFAHLEQSLANLVASASGTEKATRKALREAFFGIEAFRSKLEFVDRYVHVLADSDAQVLAQWEAARKKCESASHARNTLAHWLLIHNLAEKPGRRTVMVPPALKPAQKSAGHQDWRTSEKPPANAIGVRQLAEIRFSIFEALVMVERFHAAVAGAPEPFQGWLPMQAPTLQAMTRSFRQMIQAVQLPRPAE